MPEPTVTVLFTDRVGALDRIVSLLRRRGFPVTGMTLERTHRPDVRRMSVGVRQASDVAQVSRHLGRLPDVLDVSTADEHALYREYALLRVRCTPAQRAEILAVLSSFDARPLSFTANHTLIEAAGFTQQIDALFAALADYGIEEAARTSPIALRRMSEEPAESETSSTTPARQSA